MIRIILGMLIAMVSNSAYAYTECRVKTSGLYVGDDGYMWMTFVKGGAANMPITDADFDNIYSMLLAAQMADKEVTVRFQADNVQCNVGTRSDIGGVWLHR